MTENPIFDRKSVDLTPLNPRRTESQDLKADAKDLLARVAFAMSLIAPSTARALTAAQSDVDISVDDEAAGEVMFANEAVKSVSSEVSLIAPLVRLLAGRREERLMADYNKRSQKAGRKRLQHIGNQQAKGLQHLTWRTREIPWPDVDGRALSPLEIHFSESHHDVSLTSYELKASGYIELVRACGEVLTGCGGDCLANEYMRMILTLSGIESRGGDWERGAYLLDDGFLMSLESDPCPCEPLSGHDQHLAMTVLASWIRMSRLGVNLFGREGMDRWRDFFDGTLYGSDDSMVGEIWSGKAPRRALYRTSEAWGDSDSLPWVKSSLGSPIVPVGIAAELLRRSIAKVQAIGFIPDPGKSGVVDPERRYEISDRILVQLKRHYRDLSTSPVASVTSCIMTCDGSNRNEKGSPGPWGI